MKQILPLTVSINLCGRSFRWVPWESTNLVVGTNEMVTLGVRNITPGEAWGLSKVIQFGPREFSSHTSCLTGFSEISELSRVGVPLHNKEKG